MDIDGVSTFSSFREYFDDVGSKLSEVHQDMLEQIEEDRTSARNEVTTPITSTGAYSIFS